MGDKIVVPSLEELQKRQEKKKFSLFQPSSLAKETNSNELSPGTINSTSKTISTTVSTTTTSTTVKTTSTITSTTNSSYTSTSTLNSSPNPVPVTPQRTSNVSKNNWSSNYSRTSTPSNSNSNSNSNYSTPSSTNKTFSSSTTSSNYPSRSFQVIINNRQKDNPVLKYVRNVGYVFGDIVADYQLGRATTALYLSLKYHRLHPNYIYERMKELPKNDTALRLILLVIDMEDPHNSLVELTKSTIINGFTLIVSWSHEECGRYIETYKAFESKSSDMIKGRTNPDFISQLTECLTSIKSVNKTDVVTLVSTFGSLRSIASASQSELSICPGFGTNKAKRVFDVFNQPFFPSKSQKLDE